jgi:hypothetical protein
MAFKKKLYQLRPQQQGQKIEVHITKNQKRTFSTYPLRVERDVRQMLSERISGNHMGLWLLIPEHLRLGSWDLLTSWTGMRQNSEIEPRLALQLIHEAALCVNGVRQRRNLRQKGFETLNGLPYVATDVSIHRLLNNHTVQQAECLQTALAKLRYAQGDYTGKYVLVDPHRILTWSKRQMPPKKASVSSPIRKNMQTFFAIDSDSGQPIIFSLGSSSVTASQATLKLLDQLVQILSDNALMIADCEHFTKDILNRMIGDPQFSILTPTPKRKGILKKAASLHYTPQWAGYAVADGHYRLTGQHQDVRLLAQRIGEIEKYYNYKTFVTTSDMSAVDLMTLIFPERWNIEEFFNAEQAFGWNRASTFNLNIRFGKMSLALIAQTIVSRLRQKLPKGIDKWNAQSMAQKLFSAIDGDLRVKDDKIIVTFYNAPNEEILKEHYEHLPEKLEKQGIDPRVPWLYDFKVDYRFK